MNKLLDFFAHKVSGSYIILNKLKNNKEWSRQFLSYSLIEGKFLDLSDDEFNKKLNDEIKKVEDYLEYFCLRYENKSIPDMYSSIHDEFKDLK